MSNLFFFDTDQSPERSKVSLRSPMPTPDTGWRPPRDFPRLDAAYCIGRDRETKELDFDNGPGWARGKGYVIGESITAYDRDMRTTSWYFPMRHEVEPEYNLDPDAVTAYCRDVDRMPTTKVYANSLYDVGYGIDATGELPNGELHDVQFAEAILSETDLTALDALGWKYLEQGKLGNQLYQWCADNYGGEPTGKQRANLYRTSPRLVGPYAEEDSAMLLPILLKQVPLLREQNLYNVYRMECELIPLLVKMRKRGVRIDLDKATRLFYEMGPIIDGLERDLFTMTGVWANVDASSELAKVFDAVNLPYPRTEKGNPSFTAEFLNACEHPVGHLVVSIRQHKKLKSTFLKSYILDSHNNGRIHGQYHPLKGEGGGTRVGRLSSSTPNLQNIPSRTALGRKIRELFIPDQGSLYLEKGDHCISPNMRVLTSDMRHLRADKIVVGDELIGFDEEPDYVCEKSRRKIHITKVIGVSRLVQPSFRVTMRSGVVFESSSLHKWLAKRSWPRTFQWTTTGQLRVGSLIPRLCQTWEFEDTHSSGWLAGMFDGEGWIGDKLGIAQNEGPVLERIWDELDRRGFKVEIKPTSSIGQNCFQLRLMGGRSEVWRLLGTIRPMRLLKNNLDHLEGRAAQSQCIDADVVEKIEDIGQIEVIGIETEHKTLIVEGLLSHNSQLQYRALAHFAVDNLGNNKYGDGPSSNALRDEYNANPHTDYHTRTQKMVQTVSGLYIPRSSEEASQGELVKGTELYDAEGKMIKGSGEYSEWGTGRFTIKETNFGLMFGMGKKKLIRQAGFVGKSAEQKGDDIFNAYHQGNPYVKATMDCMSMLAQRDGFVCTVMGRRTRFEQWVKSGYHDPPLIPMFYNQAIREWGSNIERAMTYKALCNVLQGTEGEIIKMGMLACYKEGLFDDDLLGPPLLTTHDEVVTDIKNESPELQQARERYGWLMENALRIRVPLVYERTKGPSWGTAKEPV